MKSVQIRQGVFREKGTRSESDKHKVSEGFTEPCSNRVPGVFLHSSATVFRSVPAYRRNTAQEHGVNRMALESLKTATDSEGRRVVPHGQWDSLFRDGRQRAKNPNDWVFNFAPETARNYIQFAKKHPDPIIELGYMIRGRFFRADLCNMRALRFPEFWTRSLIPDAKRAYRVRGADGSINYRLEEAR